VSVARTYWLERDACGRCIVAAAEQLRIVDRPARVAWQSGAMTAFGFSSTTDDVLAGVDLTGRRILVTGASTGLGEETARALAAHGALLTLPVRDLARGERAAERIAASVPGANLELRELDLSSLASVRQFADGFLAEHDTLDVLINNAGIMACPQATTVDGFELQFGTNHLGHFLLGVLLTPALLAADRARLVSLSSRGHAFSDVDLEDWNFEHTVYEPFVAYGRAKTANALFAVGYQRRFGGSGVTALSVHPGGIHTELGRHMTRETIATITSQLASRGRPFTWKTIPQGAATSVWAATAPDLAGHGGAYLEDCHVAEVSADDARQDGVRPYAIDPERAEALWALSERLVGLS
jgi:NAD(P)-dependent dehydrogenase (short-subunit alcohol dehydrogenase family)